ncbi:Cytochrome P450 monooygenase 1 [Colletotrichum spinosum]|uniref:Cytochrome P450 monooygenase 1 n=1 Tax=Colletotrichum spinosum TaxID=1347390 RepID=A0A4R8Q366_9PEZI|nr:Cytochrome P450 monooygenase 1 [Colletotrichum spinosum]
MSSLVSLAFVGSDFQQRDEWRALTSAYIGKLFPAHHVMRSWPRWSRKYVHWFLPELQDVRARLKEINHLLEPHVQRRIVAREQRQRDGKQPLKSLDSVDWALDAAKGRPFDVVGCQLALTIAALHTSSNTTWNSLLDIVYDQDIIQPLREETIRVVQEDGGLQTVSLAKLDLLDSCMKESQRMHPIQYGVMGRRVRKTTQLHDGTRIPKGVITIVAPPAMLDADVFENPGKWDGYRFLKKRQQPGEEKKWLFAATCPEQYAFGTGAHACPGRHFAGTNIKLILAHLLMRLAPSSRNLAVVFFDLSNPNLKTHAGVILTKGMLNLPKATHVDALELELHWVTEDGSPARMKSGALLQPTVTSPVFSPSLVLRN